MTMNDEVKYPVIRPEGFSEEEWQELEDMWKQMETNVKASISNGEPLVVLERITEDWGDMTGEQEDD
jgi:hypothetical protein